MYVCMYMSMYNIMWCNVQVGVICSLTLSLPCIDLVLHVQAGFIHV